MAHTERDSPRPEYPLLSLSSCREAEVQFVYRQRFSEVRLEIAAPRVFSLPAPVLLHVGRGLVPYRDSGLVRKETED
jgi:hypothetical protein